jgi:hydrogenase maturation factor
MCKALVGKVIALDNEFAIVDFKIAEKKVSNLIANAKLNDFVIVKGNLILERIEKKQGKELIAFQTLLAKRKKSLN